MQYFKDDICFLKRTQIKTRGPFKRQLQDCRDGTTNRTLAHELFADLLNYLSPGWVSPHACVVFLDASATSLPKGPWGDVTEDRPTGPEPVRTHAARLGPPPSTGRRGDAETDARQTWGQTDAEMDGRGDGQTRRQTDAGTDRCGD